MATEVNILSRDPGPTNLEVADDLLDAVNLHVVSELGKRGGLLAMRGASATSHGRCHGATPQHNLLNHLPPTPIPSPASGYHPDHHRLRNPDRILLRPRLVTPATLNCIRVAYNPATATALPVIQYLVSAFQLCNCSSPYAHALSSRYRSILQFPLHRDPVRTGSLTTCCSCLMIL
jgi:hypothetical protein